MSSPSVARHCHIAFRRHEHYLLSKCKNLREFNTISVKVPWIYVYLTVIERANGFTGSKYSVQVPWIYAYRSGIEQTHDSSGTCSPHQTIKFCGFDRYPERYAWIHGIWTLALSIEIPIQVGLWVPITHRPDTHKTFLRQHKTATRHQNQTSARHRPDTHKTSGKRLSSRWKQQHTFQTSPRYYVEDTFETAARLQQDICQTSVR